MWHNVVPGLVALATGILISLRAPLAWRLWVLPITVGAGVVVAAPLGLYDVDLLMRAPWLALPGMNWPGIRPLLRRGLLDAVAGLSCSST